MPPDRSGTRATLTRHLEAFSRRDVDGVMRDYTEASVLVIPPGPLHGIVPIRKFFTGFIHTLPTGFLDAFTIDKLEIVGDFGYLLWKAPPWVLLGTDTFHVQEDRIATQTFAVHPLSWLPERVVARWNTPATTGLREASTHAAL